MERATRVVPNPALTTASVLDGTLKRARSAARCFPFADPKERARRPGPKQPRFWGYLGDAVSMVFRPAFPSPHLKKTNDCKNLWSELNGLNFGTLSGV
jgi:hypothetical protein